MGKQAYLFVHFKEKRTPDGEQVYFGISKDGFNWETVNNGNPVLWSYEGDRGVRDFTIKRLKDGRFIILATDLSLAYGMISKYQNSWEVVSRIGSKSLIMWESTDLIHWSEQKKVSFEDEDFGCVWAPDIFYDKKQNDYVIHWSSSHKKNNYNDKAIYYSRTTDFCSFSKPRELYRKADSHVIDSALYEEDGYYYLFVKSVENPSRNILLKASSIEGPYERMSSFDEATADLEDGRYEGETAFKLENGKWCLFLDFCGIPVENEIYGQNASIQGYVPFISDTLSSGKFTRCDSDFSFPYGYKHGTVMPVTTDEYERLKKYVKSPDER